MITEQCLKLFERLECRDYARLDWRFDQHGVPKLLEVNPNPGWCWDGHLAKMAGIKGLEYTEMLSLILQTAEQRFKAMEMEMGMGMAMETEIIWQRKNFRNLLH